MIALRWILAWTLYWIAYVATQLAQTSIIFSQKSQGIYGFKHWPWSEDDLWTGQTNETEGEKP